MVLPSRAPGICVAIPVRNGENTIVEQLRAVLGQGCDTAFEVVVADNGSTDDTAGIVRAVAEQDQRVRLVDAHDAAGEPGTRNLAAKACTAPTVAFCDADDVVRAGWLAGIVNAFEAGAVAVHVTREYWTLNPVLRAAGFPEYQVNAWLAGGAFAVRRDVYLQLGGFDTSLPLCADTEFGFRLNEYLGQQPTILPDAVVSVRAPVSARGVFQRSRRHARTWADLRERHPEVMTPSESQLWGVRRGLAAWLIRHGSWLADNRRLGWCEVAGTALGEIEGVTFRRADRALGRGVPRGAP